VTAIQHAVSSCLTDGSASRGCVQTQITPIWDAIPTVLPDACSRADRPFPIVVGVNVW